MRIVAGGRNVVTSLLLMLAAGVLAGCSKHNAGLPNFADLVEQVSPSVVNISAVPVDSRVDAAANTGGDSSRQVPDWLRKFLDQHGRDDAAPKDPDNANPSDPSSDAAPSDNDANPQGDAPDDGPQGGEQSLGSGFILWSDGYILTNHHVVKDSKEVVVRLSDRRQFQAQVVGSDERSDIALLKIDAKDLPAVKLADVGRSRVGDWVLAIGSPFGFDYTVTSGILSAKGRILETEQYVPFLQTDAAVNPGNSGGPLFNLKGEVLGVNSQIYSQNGGFQGVAFAIPIDVAAKVAMTLKEGGKVTRGWLGIVMQEVDRNLAKSFGMDKPGGALIARVLADSPAQQAGLKTGDVILKYNGLEIVSSRTLKPLVGNSVPGETVTLELLREGKIVTIKVEVGTLESQDEVTPDASPKSQAPLPPKDMPLAIEVKALDDDERRAAKVVSGGVRIISIGPGPGREAGMVVGDVILSISGQEIASIERYNEVVGRLTPGQSVPVLVQRQGAPLFLALAVPPR